MDTSPNGSSPRTMASITDRILATYSQCGGINHLGHALLPSYRTVVDVLNDLYEILYPGYGRRQTLHIGNVGPYVGNLVHEIRDLLGEQIARALRHDCHATQGEAADWTDYRSEGHDLAEQFLDALPEIRRTLGDDAQAAFDGDPAAKGLDEIIFCYPGLRAVTTHRLAHQLHVLGVPLIPRMMCEYAHSKTGIDIHPGATIGRRFFIDHGTGVVVGETTIIGDNVKLYQGVTLGAVSFPRDETTGQLRRDLKRHPTIEDDVVIYANATILGGSTVIGHHSVIGSSVWITQSVEPYTIVTIEGPRLRFRGAGAPAGGRASNDPFNVDYAI